MRRYGFIFIFSIIIIAIQQAIVSKISILNVSMDMVFVFIICFSLVRDEVESISLALFCGIIRDSFFPSIFGVNTVLYIVSAYALTQIEKRIYKDAIIIPMMTCFGLTILKALVYFGYFYIASIKFNFMIHVVNLLVLESIYNSLLSLIMYRVVKKINSLKIMQHEWKF